MPPWRTTRCRATSEPLLPLPLAVDASLSPAAPASLLPPLVPARHSGLGNRNEVD